MFSNRTDAGKRLADLLFHLRDEDPVVVGLPRGGVPVAYEVARALGAPLDIILVRKLGVPYQPELAMGAIGEDGARVINADVVSMAEVSEAEIAEVEASERAELERRIERYRAGRARIPLRDRVVVIVDDGLATGATAAAASLVARSEGARKVVLAVPVAPAGWTERFSGKADELIAYATPVNLLGIGRFYRDFAPTSDREVIDFLDRARAAAPAVRLSEACDSGTARIAPRDVRP